MDDLALLEQMARTRYQEYERELATYMRHSLDKPRRARMSSGLIERLRHVLLVIGIRL